MRQTRTNFVRMLVPLVIGVIGAIGALAAALPAHAAVSAPNAPDAALAAAKGAAPMVQAGPILEPATLVLIGLGLVGLALFRQRARQPGAR